MNATITDDTETASAAADGLRRHNLAMRHLVEVVQDLSHVRDLESIIRIVRLAARELTGADGASFVLKDGDQCYYADENAIAPLWKGQRFPMDQCVSGWAMKHGRAVTIADIYADSRVPADAYRPTFVKSMAMVPIRAGSPIGAIGNYWGEFHRVTDEELILLQALASTTSVAMENVQVYAELEQRVQSRTRELDAINRELEAFTHTVSHDLRAPLRAMQGYCRLYLEDYGDSVPAAGRPVLEKVLAGTERMGKLIEDLLEFSRYGRTPLRRETLSLGPSVERIVNELRNREPERAVVVRIDPLGDCDGDPSLIEQVLVNLLSNAFKFTRHCNPAIVEIGREQAGGERVYFVRDNGVGFDAQQAAALFGVFQRLPTAETFEGTGVGLSIAQRIVQRHGGRIWAESGIGRGATFRFTLGA